MKPVVDRRVYACSCGFTIVDDTDDVDAYLDDIDVHIQSHLDEVPS